MIQPQAALAEALTQSRIDILREIEFISIFFLNMDIFEAEESEKEIVKTAAVMPSGGKIIMVINPDFFCDKLDRKQRNFVLIHEVLHCFFEHIGRQTDNNYHHKLWNVATDYVINEFIKEMSAGINVLGILEGLLFNAKYAGMTADKVYFDLLKDNGNDADKASQKHGGDSAGDGTGKSPAPLDDISPQQISEANKNKMKQEIAAGVAIAETNKNIGTGMGGVIRKIKDLLEPKIHWASLLQEYVVKAAKNSRTYNRLSRRTSGQVVFPSTTGDHINVMFGVDTSGSMSADDLKEAATEMKGICDSFDSWQLEFVTCDTGISVVGEYSDEDGDDFDNIKLDFKGGGGTDMAPIVEYSNDSENEPSVLILVTDGYVPEDTIIAAHDDIPTVFVVTSGGNSKLDLGVNIDVVVMNDV